MSINNDIIPLRSIKNGTKKSVVIVRVIKQWTQKDRFNKETIEIFLIDHEGSRIHATMSMLDEGSIVKIKNFETTSNVVTQYQKAIIDHPVRITIVQGTKIEKCIDIQHISEYGFNFIPFRSFFNAETMDDDIVVDVIGEVIKPLGIPEHVPAASNSRKLDFKLMDHEGLVLDCTLWESYADRLISHVDETVDQPVVLIIQFGKYSKWNKYVRVQSMRHATKIYFSPTIPDILSFIQRRGAGGPVPSRSIMSNDTKNSNIDVFVNSTNYKTIADLLNCKEPGIYSVWGQIDYVDHECKWYYDACGNDKCTKGVDKGSKIGDICKKCNKPIPSIVPRFKLTVSVSDTELISNGSDAKFVIFDKSSHDLLKVSAPQVLSNLLKDGDKMDMPNEFDALVDKQCLFRVEVDQKFNIDAKSSTYTVRQLTEDLELIEQFRTTIMKDCEVISKINEESTTQSVSLSNSDIIEENSSNNLINRHTASKRLLDDFEGVIGYNDKDIENSTSKGRAIKKERI